MSLLGKPYDPKSPMFDLEIQYQERRELEYRRLRFRQEIDTIYRSALSWENREKIYNALASKLGGETMSSPHYEDFMELAELLT